MSEYSELKNYVASISQDAQQSAYQLVACAENLEKICGSFSSLTATTSGSSAKQVEASFSAAQKAVLMAARSLVEAAKAGVDWSGGSVPELKLVLKPRRR